MNNAEALTIFRTIQKCRHQALHTNDCGNCERCQYYHTQEQLDEAVDMAISALKKLEKDRWRPCNEKPEYDFQNVLIRWRDKRKGCEKDYYIFEGYVVRGIWCGLFEDADISDFEPIEWKPLEPYTEEEL